MSDKLPTMGYYQGPLEYLRWGQANFACLSRLQPMQTTAAVPSAPASAESTTVTIDPRPKANLRVASTPLSAAIQPAAPPEESDPQTRWARYDRRFALLSQRKTELCSNPVFNQTADAKELDGYCTEARDTVMAARNFKPRDLDACIAALNAFENELGAAEMELKLTLAAAAQPDAPAQQLQPRSQRRPEALRRKNMPSNLVPNIVAGKPSGDAVADPKSASSEAELARLQAYSESAPTTSRQQPQPQPRGPEIPNAQAIADLKLPSLEAELARLQAYGRPGGSATPALSQKQSQPNPPSNLVPNIQPEKYQFEVNDASRRRDPAFIASDKDQYEKRREEMDLELKHVPLADEWSKIGDAVLQAWRTITTQDSVFLDKMGNRVAAIGAEPTESMGNWADLAGAQGLEKRLAEALQQLDKLRPENKAFQDKQGPAAKKAEEKWLAYSDGVWNYRMSLEGAGNVQHPRWSDSRAAQKGQMPKRQVYEGEKQKHKDLLKSISETIDIAIKHISAMQQVLADPDIANAKTKFSIGTALLLKHHGVRFQDVNLDTYNDGNLGSGSMDNFGKGACNAIDKVVYTSDGKPRYFKAEKPTDDPYGVGANPLEPVNALGIDRKAPHYANRNIASNMMSKALGLQVMPEVCIAIHNKTVGLLMDEAEGVSPMDERRRPRKPWGNLFPQQVASLQGGLNGLEWCDVLTGQADRHAGNYHVALGAQTVKVTGIDNDRAFGALQDHVMKTDEVGGFQSVGMPSLIDAQIYARIMAPGFKDSVLQGLRGLLTAKEVEATENRIDKVIAKVSSIPVEFRVQRWEDWRSPLPDNKTATDYLAEQKNGSLFARDFAQFFPRTEEKKQETEKIRKSEMELAALQNAG